MSAKKTKLDTVKTTTGKKAKKTTPKKAKLDNLDFADGKKEDKIQKARELEELVGLNEVNPYGTSIAAVFEEKLAEMTVVDLQELAVTVGVFPSGTKTSLKNKLLKAFRDYQRGSSSFIVPPSSSICEGDRDNPKFKKAIQLMQEGL